MHISQEGRPATAESATNKAANMQSRDWNHTEHSPDGERLGLWPPEARGLRGRGLLRCGG